METYILMDLDGLYIQVQESQKAWVSGYKYEVIFVGDKNTATVFGSDKFLGGYQRDYRTLVTKLQNKYIKIVASVETVRTVTLNRGE